MTPLAPEAPVPGSAAGVPKAQEPPVFPGYGDNVASSSCCCTAGSRSFRLP